MFTIQNKNFFSFLRTISEKAWKHRLWGVASYFIIFTFWIYSFLAWLNTSDSFSGSSILLDAEIFMVVLTLGTIMISGLFLIPYWIACVYDAWCKERHLWIFFLIIIWPITFLYLLITSPHKDLVEA